MNNNFIEINEFNLNGVYYLDNGEISKRIKLESMQIQLDIEKIEKDIKNASLEELEIIVKNLLENDKDYIKFLRTSLRDKFSNINFKTSKEEELALGIIEDLKKSPKDKYFVKDLEIDFCCGTSFKSKEIEEKALSILKDNLDNDYFKKRIAYHLDINNFTHKKDEASEIIEALANDKSLEIREILLNRNNISKDIKMTILEDEEIRNRFFERMSTFGIVGIDEHKEYDFDVYKELKPKYKLCIDLLPDEAFNDSLSRDEVRQLSGKEMKLFLNAKYCEGFKLESTKEKTIDIEF